MRAMYSAPITANRYAFALRFSVEKNTQPPGFTSAAHAATVPAGFGTCSSISMQVTTSYEAGLARGERFGRDFLVRDFDTAFEAMQIGDAERARRQIDAFDVRAARGHRLGQNAAAAADIENTLAHQMRVRVDPVEPYRVQFMQRLELGVRVPPAMRELAEFL